MKPSDVERDGRDAVLRFDTSAGEVTVDFDGDDGGRYEVEIRPDEPMMEDGVIIAADRAACLSLARIFGQLALADVADGEVVRIGWDEADAVGFRIVLDESGRLDGTRHESD